jgi:deoxyribodipyrimidine photolyase-related protein
VRGELAKAADKAPARPVLFSPHVERTRHGTEASSRRRRHGAWTRNVSTGLILFPHQLFESNAALAKDKRVFLVEDALYFRQYAFHKQKLVLHRATMKAHAAYLRGHGRDVAYVDSAAATSMAAVIDAIAAAKVARLNYLDPVDDWLERRLRKSARDAGLALQWHATPAFLSSDTLLDKHFAGKRAARMAAFYADQRKALDVLMDGGRPVGGRWSFDADNRKRLSKGTVAPKPERPPLGDHVREAQAYVERHFPDGPGHARDFAYPVTYDDARRWLDDFLQHRFAHFGEFEDAIAAGEPIIFHSVLSPLLNVGLLTPREVLDRAVAAAGQCSVPLNSLEGFVRQVIGWREFVRGVYVHKGRAQRTRNFWRHTRPLPRSFWDGTTGIEPVDTVIRRVRDNAYAHHIERLMILGCFMQLCEFDPDDVYRWFMEMFIDAYDWVMVPNVYGMALYADGGLITTKPYLCGSSYVLKMSDFKRGPWCDVWDGLYWRFVALHADTLRGNPRASVMTLQLQRMDASRLAAHRRCGERFLAQLV